MAQIAEGRGVALAPGEEVFVDPQDRRAARRMPLLELAPESAPEVAFYGGRPEAIHTPQAAAIDAIPVLLIDRLLKRLAGTLIRQNPWQWAQNLGPVYRAQIFRLPPSL